MTVERCVHIISEYQSLLNDYNSIYDNSRSLFFKAEELRYLINDCKSSIKRLKDMLNNYELDNSYDQNTGKYHDIYTKTGYDA